MQALGQRFGPDPTGKAGFRRRLAASPVRSADLLLGDGGRRWSEQALDVDFSQHCFASVSVLKLGSERPIVGN